MNPAIPSTHCWSRAAGLFAAVLGAVGAFSSAEAALTLTGSSLFNSTTGLYTYSYTVMNDAAATDDGVLVSFPVAPMAMLGDFSAPSGFTLSYDSFVNVVTFAEDLSVVTPESFAPGTTIEPFRFTSPVAPGAASYSILDAGAMEFTGLVTAPVPEPTAAAAASLGLAVLLGRRRRAAAGE